MNLQVSTFENYTLVSVEGRVDTTNAHELEKSILDLVDGGCSRIFLDCSGLYYISSSGLRVLLIVQKKMAASNGQLRLSHLQPGIREIFDISGFSTIFSLYADNEAALKG
jgi:anti-anti-sigma factor